MTFGGIVPLTIPPKVFKKKKAAQRYMLPGAARSQSGGRNPPVDRTRSKSPAVNRWHRLKTLPLSGTVIRRRAKRCRRTTGDFDRGRSTTASPVDQARVRRGTIYALRAIFFFSNLLADASFMTIPPKVIFEGASSTNHNIY